MVELGFQKWTKRSPREILVTLLVSFFLFFVTQIALATIPQLLPNLSFLGLLPISALVLVATMALGMYWKRILGISASAPAVVLFNILFMWGLHILVIREAISFVFVGVMNAECSLLLIAFYRIHSGDPGVVADDCSSAMLEHSGLSEVNLQCENSPLVSRVRYCKICKTGVRGFDHHCSAFGNCIGQKNHRLFMALLTGFIIVEGSYTLSSIQFVTKSVNAQKVLVKGIFLHDLVISTTLFCILQLLWQINWRKYPEFQVLIQPQPGSTFAELRFSNPYNKGIIANIRDFLTPEDRKPV